jgi:hypothetical protein
MASIINASKKQFKVKTLGRKCQHSLQFIFQKFSTKDKIIKICI